MTDTTGPMPNKMTLLSKEKLEQIRDKFERRPFPEHIFVTWQGHTKDVADLFSHIDELEKILEEKGLRTPVKGDKK